MKLRVFTLAYLLLSNPALGAPHEFAGTLISSDLVPDTGKTSLFFKVHSGNPLLDEFRVLCDSDTHKAIRAWWMTKGMFEIKLPSESLIIDPPHVKGQDATMTFDSSTLETADKTPVTLMSIKWIKKAEQGAAANP